MTQQTVNLGTAPNDGTGDDLRSAFDKTNDNFSELYGWHLAGTGQTATGIYDFAVDGAKANIDFIDLAGAKEILLMGENVTFSTSNVLAAALSVDNGTAYFTTSGNYKRLAASGVATSAGPAFLWDTSATAARSGAMEITAVNVSGIPKPMVALNDDTAGCIYYFDASTLPINAVRLQPHTGSGNVNGGKIYCLIKR